MGPADGLGARLRQSEKTDLALFDEPRHGANRILDRRVGVDAVLIIEVDDIGAETLQAGLAGADHIIRPAVDHRAFRQAQIAEFRGQGDLVALAGDRLADKILVLAVAIIVAMASDSTRTP